MENEGFSRVIDPAKKGPRKHFVKDIFLPKKTEDIIHNWENSETFKNLIIRDSLLEAMRQKSIRPDDWIHERNVSTGLYPDIDDPDFAARLYRKTEFASLRSSAVGEDTCSKTKIVFETTAVQRLVARFMHPSTPYNGVLLHHGVGVGKTCSAITVAETFLEILPMNTVYIIVPQAIADGFRRTIFDKSRLIPTSKEEFLLTGERWKSPQCTGMTYLHLTGLAGSEDKEEIAEAVEYEVKKRYKIMGYLAFANFVEAKLKEIPIAVTGQERVDAENAMLMTLFTDHLLIIDEAHNLRDSDDVEEETDKKKETDVKEGKKLTPILKRILQVSEGLRLMLMTATPMYNTAPEILFLLNLLTLNDTKDESLFLKMKDIFKEDHTFTPHGEEKLAKIIKRYVSFMRGEHPNTFPLRLRPENSITEDFEYPYMSMKLAEKNVKLTAMDTKIMHALPLVVHSITPSTKMGAVLTNVLKQHIEKGVPEEGGREVTNLDSYIQIGNMVYPDGTYGKTGLANYFDEKKTAFSNQKMIQYSWKKKHASTPIESVFGYDGLLNHSPKIASIVKSVTNAKGISFVYSRYKKSGAIAIAIALELAGWCRVLANGVQAPLLKQDTTHKPTNFYVLLTSDEMLSPDFKGLLQYATTFKNDEERNGSKVKAIIGSQIASEGLDLKCIREIHLLEGWFHLNRIEQIEGRGVRFCSHADLPLKQRNCLIYLHVLNVPVYETADLYMYRLAIQKAQPIGRVTRLMKIHAWDCMLNRDAILLTDLPKRNIIDAQGRILNGYNLQDQPFTSFCDFSDTCEFLCASKPIPGENKSTYTEKDFHVRLLKKQELLADIFSDEVALPLKTIRETVYSDLPWSIGEIGLREVLGKMKIKRIDGIIGTLIYMNGYIVFQPDRVTDIQIPLALRYGRAYGLLPRTMEPPHESVLESVAKPIQKVVDAEVEVESDVETETETEKEETDQKPKKVREKKKKIVAANESNRKLASYKDILGALSSWKSLVELIFMKEYGYIDPPAGMSDDMFRGWRWTFYHFRSIPETKYIAYRWYIDNLLSAEEKHVALLEWTTKGITNLTPVEREYAKLFLPVELFQSETIRGSYLYFPFKKDSLQIFCVTELNKDPMTCPSILNEEIKKIVGPPVDRINDTDTIFGFLTYIKNKLYFKSALKDNTKRWINGAQCQIVSNLDYHLPRIQEIHKTLKTIPGIRDLLFDDRAETKPDADTSEKRKAYLKKRYMKKTDSVEAALNQTHVHDLSLKQICPYIEFLLRYMDMKQLNGKRWFLSVVDMARIPA